MRRKRRDVHVPRKMASARGSDGSGGREAVFEVVDGGDEVTLPDGHDEVDGVEVALAVKATAKIGTRFDGREEFFA